MKNTTMTTMHSLRLLLSGAMAALLLAAAGGAHAQAYVNATVGGELAPGVYGRINIGNAPPPPLIYAEPVIIHRPAVVVPRAPRLMANDWGGRPIAVLRGATQVAGPATSCLSHRRRPAAPAVKLGPLWPKSLFLLRSRLPPTWRASFARRVTPFCRLPMWPAGWAAIFQR